MFGQFAESKDYICRGNIILHTYANLSAYEADITEKDILYLEILQTIFLFQT